MAKTAVNPDEAIYRHLQDKESQATQAQLQKASGLDDDAFAALFADMRARMWLEADDSGKTEKFSLTETGRRHLAGYYPDPA